MTETSHETLVTSPSPEHVGREQPPIAPEWIAALRAIFHYDVLHIRQELLTLSQKYHVTDEWDQPRFFVVRPPRLALNLLLNICVSIIRFGILFWAVSMFMRGENPGMVIAVLIFTNFWLAIVHVLLAPYRHIEVFSDESQSWRLLTITQDNKLALWRQYTLFDCFGNEVARMKRNTIASIMRRDWEVETPTGEMIMRVREDSWARALMRRYMGPLFGVLRTNFNFEYPDGKVFGFYDRKLTLTDQYVLDLRGDSHHLIDRRVSLAMSILLDTAESR